MPKTGDLSQRTLLEKPLAMDHKVAQDTGSALRGVATLFGQLYVQLPQQGLNAVSAHLCQELAALLGYPIAGLLQHNSQDQCLVPVAISNGSQRDGSIPWPTQLTTIGIPEYSPIQVCSDAARQLDEPLSTYLKEVRLLAGACVPIKLGTDVWGVLLLLDHRPSTKPAHHTRDILDLVMPLLCSLIEADQKGGAKATAPLAPEPLEKSETSDEKLLLRSELAEATKRLQHLEHTNLAFEDYGEPMCILDRTGNTVFANKAYRQLIPNPTQSVPTRFETQQMLADPTVSSRIGAAFRSGALSWQEEVALRDSSGALLPVELRVDVMKNQHGERVGFVALCKDLRARRAVTQRLQLMESVALRTHDAIFITQRHAGPPPRFVTRFANPAFCLLTGFQAEDIHEQEPSFLCGPQTDPAARERLLQASSTQELVEQELLCYRKDGSTFWAELAIFPIKQESEGAELRYVALRDISERKYTQEALRRSEASYRLLADSIVDVVSLHRLDGFVLFVSPSIERLTGLNVVNNIGNLVCERIHPSDRTTVQDMLQSTRLHGNARCEWRLQTKAGHFIWLETTARSVAQAEGQAMQLVCCSRDITERADKSERALARNFPQHTKSACQQSRKPTERQLRGFCHLTFHTSISGGAA